MGILRTWLALLVVFAHLNIDPAAQNVALSGGALMAVQLFFMLSGFYMALVWHEKYSHDTTAFYTSRALRLFPLYWIILLLTLFAGLIHPALRPDYMTHIWKGWTALLNSPTPWMVIPAAFSNLTFFGLDVAVFSCVDWTTSKFSVHMNGQSCKTTLESLIIVPQAWSLGLEVLFYALCPFIFRRGQFFTLILFIASLALRGYLLGDRFQLAQWDRHLIPTEL